MNSRNHLCAIAVAIVVASTGAVRTADAQGFGGFGGGVSEDLELVDRFDADGNGRLDLEERNLARASVGSGQGGFNRRGGFGGFGSSVQGSRGVEIAPDEVRIYDDESLYDESVLRTIFLEFESSDWESELAAFKDTDVEVPARVTVDGREYPDVGVHFRGASSFSMVSAGSKRSLNLSFDFVDEDQDLLGFRTLNLLNANGDPSFLRTVLYSHISREFLPTPRTNFMRVVINGENWGIYINAQQFNKDFAEDWFGSRDGARWKVPGSPGGRAGMEYIGEDIAAYKRIYDIKSKDKQESWQDMIEMFRVLNQTPLEELPDAIEPLLDVDGVLRFLALEIAMNNSDGYWARASDYSIYQEENGKFHIVAHDFNETLSSGGGGFRGGFGGGFGGGGTNLNPLSGLTDRSQPLRSRLLQVPEYQERYLGYVREIAEDWFDWDEIEPLLSDYRDLIAEDVARDTRKLYSTAEFDSSFDGSSNSLRRFLADRRAYLLGFLDSRADTARD